MLISIGQDSIMQIIITSLIVNLCSLHHSIKSKTIGTLCRGLYYNNTYKTRLINFDVLICIASWLCQYGPVSV